LREKEWQGRRVGGFTHIADILAELDWLADLEREVLMNAERDELTVECER
jgi:hypothetical protein